MTTPDLMAALQASLETARAESAERRAAWAARAVTIAAGPAPDQSHDDECEAEFVEGAMAWTLCQCDERVSDHVRDPDAPLGDD